MDTKDFINKLRALPAKAEQYKAFGLGDLLFVKSQGMIDYLSVVYKSMPEEMRAARKKGMRSSFRTFRYLDEIDKMFLSKGFLQEMGYSLVKRKEFEAFVKDLCSLVSDDGKKLMNMLESKQ